MDEKEKTLEPSIFGAQRSALMLAKAPRVLCKKGIDLISTLVFSCAISVDFHRVRTHSLSVLPYPRSTIVIQDIVVPYQLRHRVYPPYLHSSVFVACSSAFLDRTSPLTLCHVCILLSRFLYLLIHPRPRHHAAVSCRPCSLVRIALSSFLTLFLNV